MIKLMWQQIPSTVVSELLCQNSFDGVVLDTEHGCFSNETIYSCIQTITNKNKQCFVRLTEISPSLIRWCLDAGTTGLIFSTIESEKQIDKILQLCLYPEFGGQRGLGLVRSNLWGKSELVDEGPILVAQIETESGVELVRRGGLKESGLDYYLIGPYDLSSSLGCPGNFTDKRYLNSIRDIEANIDKRGLGIHIPKNVSKHIGQYKDYGLVALGMDTISILEQAEELENL